MFSSEITGVDALLNFKAFKIVTRFFAFFFVKFQMQSQMVFTINYTTLIVTYSLILSS